MTDKKDLELKVCAVGSAVQKMLNTPMFSKEHRRADYDF